MNRRRPLRRMCGALPCEGGLRDGAMEGGDGRGRMQVDLGFFLEQAWKMYISVES